MINDKVRTASYAQFILTNPSLFRDAVVLDVGCGTGILSLFAARSGAKRVIAVDASDIGERAKKIVKANNFEDIITVVRGKVEDITLPDDITQVDIIISEWMGYALLYESMLDSVLVARDRFLKPGGVMAPSQTKMLIGLCDASDIAKERIEFWDDVYGMQPVFLISIGVWWLTDIRQGSICRPCRRACTTMQLLMLWVPKRSSASPLLSRISF